jgi:hypothetical protein
MLAVWFQNVHPVARTCQVGRSYRGAGRASTVFILHGSADQVTALSGSERFSLNGRMHVSERFILPQGLVSVHRLS